MSTDRIVFETGAASDKGLVRAVNEDAYLLRPGIGVWVVSDGMGGHSAGQFASHMVVDGLSGIDGHDDAAALVADCSKRLAAVNDRLREAAQSMGHERSGATVVALILHETTFACLWCGDSRIYRVRAGMIQQLTRDHSEVEELIGRGLISRDDAKSWPRKNVITRAIGVAETLAVETLSGEIEFDDVFLLCSDGLTAHLSDAEIGATCVVDDVQEAADRLVAATLERGAKDNVTVIVVRCIQREPTVLDFTGMPRANWARVP
ncbi:MAG: protein phosphatase 2C domain-containing protein [Ancalomicrobiaceae bacterium]|nr:protein phosphatase 2C domain-containing protein [Ancalomicrobiaceae bacterium]